MTLMTLPKRPEEAVSLSFWGFSNFGDILVQKMHPLSLGTTSSKVSAIPVLSYAAVRVP